MNTSDIPSFTMRALSLVLSSAFAAVGAFVGVTIYQKFYVNNRNFHGIDSSDIDSIITTLRDCEMKRKKQYRPKRIILIRHGQSLGQVEESTYRTMPDNQVPLTEQGISQAENCGQALKNIIGNETVKFWVSPYRRSRMTFEGISKAFSKDKISYREEPRIREQDWGNFQDPKAIKLSQIERFNFGSFYYRFHAGESGADVYDRVSSFLESLFRDFEVDQSMSNVVLVSHGLTCRLFLMRFFHWSVEKFQRTWNLKNCQIVIMEKQEDGFYKLMTPLEENPKDS